MAMTSAHFHVVPEDDPHKIVRVATELLAHECIEEPHNFAVALPLAFAMACRLFDIPVEDATRQFQANWGLIDANPTLRNIVEELRRR